MSSRSELALSVRGLTKAYSIAHGAERPTTLAEAMIQRLKHPFRSGPREWFRALNEVSFDVKKGDVVGIIGRNGAGKSTLLKVLSRITRPTSGEVRLYGRVGSLLEVGTGFHPELTGRENIYLNGSILGMRRREIERQFEEIVDFSGVEKFLDTPVKRFSSGMYVRLAFAVAAHLNPEILLVDEVLAVGDAEFQKKCLGKMHDVAGQGRSVLFVSHNMGVVQTLCKRGIVLVNHQVFADTTAGNAVATYLRTIEHAAQEEVGERTDRRGIGQVRVCGLEISTGGDMPSATLATGMPARFEFHFSGVIPGMRCRFTIYDTQGFAITDFNTDVHGPEDSIDPVLRTTFIWETDELVLLAGRYRINVAVEAGDELQDHIEGAKVFDVEEGQVRGRPAPRNGWGCRVFMPHRWRLAPGLRGGAA